MSNIKFSTPIYEIGGRPIEVAEQGANSLQTYVIYEKMEEGPSLKLPFFPQNIREPRRTAPESRSHISPGVK